MNSLNQAIQDAYRSNGNQKEVNKAYLEFIKANFIIPLEQQCEVENPQVLFLKDDSKVFLPVFTEMAYLNAWAKPIKNDIKLLKLSAVDLLKGIGDEVTISLDIGSAFYKEFRPEEIARMRSMVIKLFKNSTNH
ncbi:MAG: SseB family protein [Legionella sp.]|nr:SseB family protein [Legionella sp.]